MNDFDFFTGTWNVRNRWRTDFLDETSEWEEFPGISRASRHFGGAANFDEIDFPTKGFSGLTLRLYARARAMVAVLGQQAHWHVGSAGRTVRGSRVNVLTSADAAAVRP